MRNFTLSILCFVVCFPGLYAMEFKHAPDTYEGKKVTVDNLLQMGGQRLPVCVVNEVKKFFRDKKFLREVLVEQAGIKVGHGRDQIEIGPENTKRDIQNKLVLLPQVGKQVLQQYRDRGDRDRGVQSMPVSANYVLRLPETEDCPQVKDYYVKISGPTNRLMLKAFAQNLNPFKTGWRKVLEKYDPRKAPRNTYQTASRKFGYLRLLEAIKLFKLNELEIPNFGIVPINAQRPNSCEDRDCVFVVQDLKTKDEYILLSKVADRKFNKETIRQLVIATIYAGLWNHNPGNLLVNTKRKIAIIDTEQPANTKPEQRFNKDMKKLKHNISVGIKDLSNCFSGESDQRKWIDGYYKEYIKSLDKIK